MKKISDQRGAVIRRKVKEDQSLNLSEIAFVTGYNRASLTAMSLPLQNGKMFYSDFRRVLRARQDVYESAVSLGPKVDAALAAEAEARRMRVALDDPNQAEKWAMKLFFSPHRSKSVKAAE